MIISSAFRCAALASFGFCLAPTPSHAGSAGHAYVLKAGQEITFSVEIHAGEVIAGPPRFSKIGTAKPAEGEITVGLTARDKDLYSQILVVEASPLPVDFVATGQIGEIKIDEREVCGRLGAPIRQRIGGTSWTVALGQFAVGRGDGACP